jgi:hypothetical protein
MAFFTPASMENLDLILPCGIISGARYTRVHCASHPFAKRKTLFILMFPEMADCLSAENTLVEDTGFVQKKHRSDYGKYFH